MHGTLLPLTNGCSGPHLGSEVQKVQRGPEGSGYLSDLPPPTLPPPAVAKTVAMHAANPDSIPGIT